VALVSGLAYSSAKLAVAISKCRLNEKQCELLDTFSKGLVDDRDIMWHMVSCPQEISKAHLALLLVMDRMVK
jgi:hypothetical protein